MKKCGLFRENDSEFKTLRGPVDIKSESPIRSFCMRLSETKSNFIQTLMPYGNVHVNHIMRVMINGSTDLLLERSFLHFSNNKSIIKTKVLLPRA